jgi:hypothetical protein
MKKHLLISFIAFNLLLSQAYAFTPEELAQAEKNLTEPYRRKLYTPVFTQSQIVVEAQRLHDVAIRESQEQKMRDLKIQKERAINYLYLRTACSKEDAIAQVEAEDFDVFKFNAECEAEEARQLAEIEAERARWEAAQVRLKAELDAEFAAEEAERFAEEVRWGAERDAEQARWEAARAAEVAREKAEDTCREVERVAQRAAEEARIWKIDALIEGGIDWLEAPQYVEENPNLDVDAFLKLHNEKIEERQKIGALWQALSSYGFDGQLIDVILQDSDFNLPDLSDLGREKLEVINYLMRQNYSYKQAIDFVKDANFDVDVFYRAEDERRDAERAAYEAEQMRQAIETMRSKSLSVEDVNAVLADEDFDVRRFNAEDPNFDGIAFIKVENKKLEEKCAAEEAERAALKNARQEILGAKIKEAYIQTKSKISDENRARYIAVEQVIIESGLEEDRLELFDYQKSQMPNDFHWRIYLDLNPDLINASDSIVSEEAREEWAIKDYFLHGQFVGRFYKR